MTIGGQQHVILAFIDWYSRAMWCELVPFQYVAYFPWAMQRAFAFMHTRYDTVQSDNGVNLAPGMLHLTSRIQRYAFTQGVRRWDFVPIAEAFRNGKVERVIQTIKEELEAQQHATLEKAKTWLNDYLYFHNFQRIHQGISTRAKGGLQTPSHLADLHMRPCQEPKVLEVPTNVHGIVSYRRMVVDGIFDLQYPNNAIAISHNLNGQYPALVLDTRTQTAQVEVGDTTGTYTVGTVIIEKNQEYLHCAVDAEYIQRFTPVALDTIARLRSEAKAMKRPLPKPGKSVNGCEKRFYDGGFFQVIDTPTGEIVYDSRCGVIPDHAKELYGISA